MTKTKKTAAARRKELLQQADGLYKAWAQGHSDSVAAALAKIPRRKDALMVAMLLGSLLGIEDGDIYYTQERAAILLGMNGI